jgi:uncharacterized membrane protein HdeD (DUF308 family)
VIRPYVGSWKSLAVHGVAAVLFGLATLVWPDVTLWALVVLWGAFALVDGTTALWAAITDRLLLHRGWVGFWGVTGIAAGIVTFAWPEMTALALLWVIAIWSLLVGGSRIALAITSREALASPWTVALGGVLLVVLGVLLVVDPASGALGITWAIGWLALFYGGAELWLASVVRHETREVASSRPIRVQQPGHAAG